MEGRCAAPTSGDGETVYHAAAVSSSGWKRGVGSMSGTMENDQ